MIRRWRAVRGRFGHICSFRPAGDGDLDAEWLLDPEIAAFHLEGDRAWHRANGSLDLFELDRSRIARVKDKLLCALAVKGGRR